MVKVKICGITNLADAAATAQAGADLLGFIFYERSPRYVTPEIVRTIINEQLGMNKAAPVFVGVFVNATIETIRQIMDFCRLDAAQLHGDEPPEFVSQFQGRVYKALRPRSLVEAEALVVKYQPVLRPTSPPHLPLSESPPLPTHQSSLLPTFLFDAYHPDLYGGTGQVTDWTMAASIARRYPMMLAGSLTPANVAQAIDAVQPWGVDVSSGVEADKGKKDHQKVRAFIEMARATSPGSPKT